MKLLGVNTSLCIAWTFRITCVESSQHWLLGLFCKPLRVLNYFGTGYLDCFTNGVRCLCKHLTAWIVFNIYVSIGVIFTMLWNSLCSNSEWVTSVLIQMVTILLLQILLTERHCRVGWPNRRIVIEKNEWKKKRRKRRKQLMKFLTIVFYRYIKIDWYWTIWLYVVQWRWSPWVADMVKFIRMVFASQ